MDKPDYHKIYSDIITYKYPHKLDECKKILSKNKFSELDVLDINQRIFGKKSKSALLSNARHRSFNKSTIVYILNYQKKCNLNNSQLAAHFKLSRNTVAKWKKTFLV
ncbi:helix-turn-helix domain-containing protein [Chryseobacterium elymi]|uniref:Helix-turn-helix domain-containing protein n=1 Tax=Chryseobacterium elymi TaxID=395936 RepID=A0A3D9D918_9FLAO|nr:helix-turn-helix domain-containing protein [Chryseobacterium elymi]REC74495.1 helix-turn-helix domain-containing protein [Chryseobacterium elymi]